MKDWSKIDWFSLTHNVFTDPIAPMTSLTSFAKSPLSYARVFFLCLSLHLWKNEGGQIKTFFFLNEQWALTAALFVSTFAPSFHLRGAKENNFTQNATFSQVSKCLSRSRAKTPTENDSIGFGDVKFVLASVALISQRSFISETGSLLTRLSLCHSPPPLLLSLSLPFVNPIPFFSRVFLCIISLPPPFPFSLFLFFILSQFYPSFREFLSRKGMG